MSKTDKELAVDLTVALLNHNAKIHVGGPEGIGNSKDIVLNSVIVSQYYDYFLAVLQGKVNPFQQNKK